MLYSGKFDPVLIVSQMTFLQAGFYLAAGFWLVLLNTFVLFGITLGDLLSWNSFDWPVVAAHVLSAPVGSWMLLKVVGRAKKCLDFTVTVYIFHLVLCVAYDGFPFSLQWWLVNSLCCAGTVVLGECLCMRQELEDIPRVGCDQDHVPFLLSYLFVTVLSVFSIVCRESVGDVEMAVR